MRDDYKQAILYFTKHQKCSITFVAKLFHIDRECLANRLKEQGLHQDRRKKYFCNSDFFEKIDNEDKAYWLGFITADGCIKNNNSLNIFLKDTDINILKRFLVSIEATNKIINEKRFVNNKFIKAVGIRLFDVKICNDLKKYGVVPRKTFIAKFNPDNHIPPQYINAYIRGLFDGDGWVSDFSNGHEIGFCGTYNICNNICEIFNKQLNVKCKVTKIKSIYRIRISNKNGIQTIAKYMYNNAHNYLQRKYDIINKIAVLDETTM